MSETRESEKFIKKERVYHAPFLLIEKNFRSDKSGEPDIKGVYKGMPFYFESKLLNPISFKNYHPFAEIQIDTLTRYSRSGNVCLGLLFCGNKVKYLFPNELKEYLSHEDWERAREFNWDTLKSHWMENILTSFS